MVPRHSVGLLIGLGVIFCTTWDFVSISAQLTRDGDNVCVCTLTNTLGHEEVTSLANKVTKLENVSVAQQEQIAALMTQLAARDTLVATMYAQTMNLTRQTGGDDVLPSLASSKRNSGKKFLQTQELLWFITGFRPICLYFYLLVSKNVMQAKIRPIIIFTNRSESGRS